MYNGLYSPVTDLVLIATGLGVVPMIQMVKELLPYRDSSVSSASGEDTKNVLGGVRDVIKMGIHTTILMSRKCAVMVRGRRLELPPARAPSAETGTRRFEYIQMGVLGYHCPEGVFQVQQLKPYKEMPHNYSCRRYDPSFDISVAVNFKASQRS